VEKTPISLKRVYSDFSTFSEIGVFSTLISARERVVRKFETCHRQSMFLDYKYPKHEFCRSSRAFRKTDLEWPKSRIFTIVRKTSFFQHFGHFLRWKSKFSVNTLYAVTKTYVFVILLRVKIKKMLFFRRRKSLSNLGKIVKIEVNLNPDRTYSMTKISKYRRRGHEMTKIVFYHQTIVHMQLIATRQVIFFLVWY